MTVAELIDQLSALPADALVVLSRDAEGNGYSPLAEYALGVYVPENTWAGEWTDADLDDDRQPAVCLWPTN